MEMYLASDSHVLTGQHRFEVELQLTTTVFFLFQLNGILPTSNKLSEKVRGDIRVKH